MAINEIYVFFGLLFINILKLIIGIFLWKIIWIGEYDCYIPVG